jgi:sporulation protein YlmC with PRC-barrel domain
MAHCGCLGTRSVPDNIRDIRGASVRGPYGERLGKVDDVIFDHVTMEIRYLLVESGGWSKTGIFLLPADRVSADENHEDDLKTAATVRQIENSPKYHKQSLQTEEGWNKYEQEFNKYWDEQPTISEESGSSQGRSLAESTRRPRRRVNAADLFPERISDVFSDPAPSGGKVTLRPKSAARSEDASSGMTLLKPRWWEGVENYLRLNRDDIQARCSQCTSKAA